MKKQNLKSVKFMRVRYGKKDVPKAMREYRIFMLNGQTIGSGPVGTRSEIYDWAKANGIPRSKVVISERKWR